MIRKFLRAAAPLIAAAVLIAPLSACGSPRRDFTVAVSGVPRNLDPQFASGAELETVLFSSFEGLCQKDSLGVPQLALAERYTLSPDRLRYTFALREDAKWSDGSPVTADDFVFSFHRLFDAAAPSPQAALFADLQNAEEVQSGALPLSALGVSAPDAATLVFTLQRPSAFFLERLCAPAALPCNRAFFEGTAGRYGLSPKMLLSNGPFVVSQLSESGLTLTRNDQYRAAGGVLPQSVKLLALSAADAAAQFQEGKIDLLRPDHGQLAQFSAANSTTQIAETVTVALCLNPQSEVLQNIDLREALVTGFSRGGFDSALPSGSGPAVSLVPFAVSIEGVAYRQLSGPRTPPHSAAASAAALRRGLEATGLGALPGLRLIVPENIDLGAALDIALQGYQRDLSAYFSISRLGPADFAAALRAGSFDAAVVPLTASDEGPLAFFESFAAGAYGPIAVSDGGAYAGALQRAAEAGQKGDYLAACRELEEILLGQHIAIPLCHRNRYLVSARGVEGVAANISLDTLNFVGLRRG